LKLTGKQGDGWIPVGPRWAGDFYPKPDAYAQMKERITSGLKERHYDPEKFVFSMLINYADDMTVLRKETNDYIDAGLNYFILGMGRPARGLHGKDRTSEKRRY